MRGCKKVMKGARWCVRTKGGSIRSCHKKKRLAQAAATRSHGSVIKAKTARRSC